MKKYSLLAFIFLGAIVAQAQEKITDAHVSNYKDWAISANIGNLYTQGDLSTFNQNGDPAFDFQLGYGLSVTKYLNSVWGIKGQATFGTLSGFSSNGNVEFESSYFDYNLNAVINLSALALKGVKEDDRNWTLLTSAGLGMSQTQQDLYVNREDNPAPVAEYAQVDSNQYTNEIFVPVDLTLKYAVSNSFDIDLGLQAKYFFSDIIDAFPGGKSNDLAFYTHVGLTYNFGKKEAQSVIYTNPLDDMYASIESVREDYDKLTSDDDGDGVNNYFDKDNSTPEGAPVTGSGEARDVDGDGIPDHEDEDPFTQKGAQVDEQGRAVDSDGDGVPDVNDEEANTPEGQLVNFQGKEVAGAGGTSNGYLPSVFFAFNSANISAANHYRLVNVAQVMKNNSNLKVNVVGYADKRGPEEYNKNLASRRAKAVVEELSQKYGIDKGRFTTKSEGEASPLAENQYNVNRRVDIIPQ